MATCYSNILSTEEIEYINQLPEVVNAKKRLISSKNVYFSISLPDSIKNKIQEKTKIIWNDLQTESTAEAAIQTEVETFLASNGINHDRPHLLLLCDALLS